MNGHNGSLYRIVQIGVLCDDEIFAISKRQLNTLFNDTKLELGNIKKRVSFSYYFLYIIQNPMK